MNAAATRWHALKVASVVAETHDSKSFEFDIPADFADSFTYRPGQFLTLRVPVLGRHLPRCYSMSSAPTLDSKPRVTVKRVAQGRASNWLCDHLKAGDTLEVMAPAGVFTPRALQTDFILFAGGSGITPVFSILRSALAHGQGRIALIYANRDERSVIFREALKEVAAAHPSRLQVIHWLDSVQGVPSVAQLGELARPWRGAQAFICGPSAFMDASVAALESIGMPGDAVHVERFVSLPDEEDVAAVSAAAAAVAPTAAVEQAELEVSLDGERHTIACGGSETLLEAMLRAGINAPHSCQAGMCASCMCQVEEGSVHLRHNEALDQKDLDRAWTLSCQAVPTSGRLRVRFPG
ncbi:ferredoxin--NADP reductase [Aromatoleum toluclasticum]|uniref:ferredoxin--NADP reductase n=1 Tax=Aromatoleum toluclasticum TaxID=92003 RepID=UPI001D182FB4|nr:ferredoxin--NADP reductase [Aromatoleum toluclasticum]MCC4117557.1 ferredoxin--NADP reductase [Aromatoleum toluclasticum]